MIVIVLILVSATVQMVSAAGEQSWHLLGEDHNYGGTPANDGTAPHLIDCNMSKTLTATNTYKALNYTKTTWWYAEYPARCNLTFPAGGDWIVRVDHEKRSGWNWSADVYKVASDGTAISFASGSAPASNIESGFTNITCNQGAEQTFDISNGDRLSLRIKHDDTTQEVTTYFYKDPRFSSLTSPSTDPGYPVPEPATIILFSAGLLILAGYVYVGRRSK
jgi:hypothetical protein